MGKKIYNCDFSVLRIISQLKVLVGALVINLSLWKRKSLGQIILSHLVEKNMWFFTQNTFSTKTFGGYIGNGNDLNLREPLKKNLGVSAE